MKSSWKNIGFSEEQLLDNKSICNKLDRYWTRANLLGDGKTGRGKGGKGAKKKNSNIKCYPMKEFSNDLDNPIYVLKCRYLHALTAVA